MLSLCAVYAMTEIGIMMHFPAESKASKPLSVGVPTFNTAAKVDLTSLQYLCSVLNLFLFQAYKQAVQCKQ